MGRSFCRRQGAFRTKALFASSANGGGVNGDHERKQRIPAWLLLFTEKFAVRYFAVRCAMLPTVEKTFNIHNKQGK
jgi:hypothetical protein